MRVCTHVGGCVCVGVCACVCMHPHVYHTNNTHVIQLHSDRAYVLATCGQVSLHYQFSVEPFEIF